MPTISVHTYCTWQPPTGRRLFEEDYPLQIVLEGSCAHRNSKLVLRDNTYSTIQWDAFTQPELQNFIQILQREEDIYADKVGVCGVVVVLNPSLLTFLAVCFSAPTYSNTFSAPTYSNTLSVPTYSNTLSLPTYLNTLSVPTYSKVYLGMWELRSRPPKMSDFAASFSYQKPLD